MNARFLTRPMLSALIAALWLLLQQSLALPHLLTAVVLAIGLPCVLSGFLAVLPRPRAAGAALRLLGVVLFDIAKGNLAVAWLVLSPRALPAPLWVPVELRLRDPRAIAVLACIISNAPGTVTCQIDEDTHSLLVHALDGRAGVQVLCAEIQNRYETPLMEIFE